MASRFLGWQFELADSLPSFYLLANGKRNVPKPRIFMFKPRVIIIMFAMSPPRFYKVKL